MHINRPVPFENRTRLFIPLVESSIKAGFPSPADDYMQRAIDLNEELIQNPSATFFVRVNGDSMRDAGICHGDTLVVDRSLEAISGSVIVALLNGEFTVKYLRKKCGGISLEAAHPDYRPIKINEGDDFQVWGVVSNAIHHFTAT